MRKVKYYTKHSIRIIFAILVIIVIVCIPILAYEEMSEEDSGLGVVDQVDFLPILDTTVTLSNEGYDSVDGYGADVSIAFDESDFKGYVPVDYLFVAYNQTFSNSWMVNQNDPLYWAPNYSTLDEVQDSIAYEKLMNNNIEIDESPYGGDEVAIENAKQDAIKNHILNNNRQYGINVEEPLGRIHVDDFVYTIDIAVKFEKYIEGEEEPRTATALSENKIRVQIKEPTRHTNEAIHFKTPNVTFNNDTDGQNITKEGGVKKHDVINKFIYSKDPNGDLSAGWGYSSTYGLSTISSMTNLYAPRFWVTVEDIETLDIFDVVPTVSLTMWLSDNDKVSEYDATANDVLIYNDSKATMTDWTFSNKMIVMDAIKLSDFPGVYDDTNTLSKPYIKFYAKLNYTIKEESEILAQYPEATFDVDFPFGESLEYTIGEDVKPMLVASDDLKIFQDMALFDKSDIPEFMVYPNYDDAGRLFFLFVTKDQYIFESPFYDAAKVNMYIKIDYINDRTGQLTQPQIFLPRFEYTDEFGDRLYYGIQYPNTALFETETYYYASSSSFTWKFTYTADSSASAIAYDNTQKTLDPEEDRLSFGYDYFIFLGEDEIDQYDENIDGLTFVTSDNFHEANTHVAPNIKKLWMIVIIILIITVIIPLIIFIILLMKNRIIEHKLFI